MTCRPIKNPLHSLQGTSRCVVALILFLTLGFGATADDKAQGAWLGVRLNGMASDGGIQVAGIFEGSPADRAGLRARDTILTFDGKPVTSMRELVGTIRQREPGGWLPLTVLRQGKEVELSVRLGDRPAKISRDGMRRGWIGIEAIDLPSALREHFGAPAEAGVMISEVAVGSPAEAAGFELGDVVYEIDMVSVGSLRALRELVEGGGVGNRSEYSVARSGAALVLEARIEKAPPKAGNSSPR